MGDLDRELALVTYIGWYDSRHPHRSPMHARGGRTRRQAPQQVLDLYDQRTMESMLVPK